MPIDVHADEAQLGELELLAALLNQDIHIGHLALDLNACELELRHTLALRGAGGATPEQIEDVVDIMLGGRWARVSGDLPAGLW